MLRSLIRILGRSTLILDSARYLLEWGYRPQRRLIQHLDLNPASRLLDCGCGTGTFSHLFDPDIYLGIDLSREYIQAAKRQHPLHRFLAMDARSLDFDAESFDCVTVFGVLHHLSDQEAQRVCGELARVLRPGGRLLVCEDIPTRSPWNLIGRAVHHFDFGAQIRPPDGYARLLEPSFELIDREHFRSGFMDYVAFHCIPRIPANDAQDEMKLTHSSHPMACS